MLLALMRKLLYSILMVRKKRKFSYYESDIFYSHNAWRPMDYLNLTPNISKINAFCKKHHVIFFAFFGSVLTANFNEKSDIDILVKFDVNNIPTIFDVIDMESELTSMMGRRVDLRTPSELSPYFRDDVLSKAKVVYAE